MGSALRVDPRRPPAGTGVLGSPGRACSAAAWWGCAMRFRAT